MTSEERRPRVTVPDIDDVRRVRVNVSGLVQGVGFRPFVYAVAVRNQLGGFVLNCGDGVTCEVEGSPAAIDLFCADLIDRLPLPGRIDEINTRAISATGSKTFSIRASISSEGSTIPPPDVAMCAECRRELSDTTDRRYRHPFISCARCGPRFTIVESLPYDRDQTTMARFPMCPTCRGEFTDARDRRHHAQTIACNDCGPKLRWVGDSGRPTEGGAIDVARARLSSGAIVAVKGIGGYHLACDARDEAAVAALRRRKGRGDKPFAVMVASIEVARGLVDLDKAGCEALEDLCGQIVILPRRSEPVRGVAPSVAPGSPDLGLLLPYAPIHDLLLEQGTEIHLDALVMTSGNRGGEPIAIDDGEVLTSLASLADGWLMHDRPIVVPCDDSVVRMISGSVLPVRRSRGKAPLPIPLPHAVRPLLAVGGDLKTCACLAVGGRAWMSAHIGDMERSSSHDALARAVQHLETLLNVRAEAIVADQHPAYRTGRWAEEVAGDRPVLRVQHHHAHLASLIVDTGHPPGEPVLGFVFDGAGLGLDGSIWGGELLLAADWRFERVGSLAPVCQPGGDAAVRRPYRMALSHLAAAGVPWSDDLPCVAACPPEERGILARQLATGLASVQTSSMGRLFDAVSSICGVCQTAEYEAEAAMRFEGLARAAVSVSAPYDFPIEESESFVTARPESVVREVVADIGNGESPALISARFHAAVAHMIANSAELVAHRTGVQTVGLTGGVFLNARLSQLSTAELVTRGFTVLRHGVVPPSDAGLALGQAAIASLP